MHPPTPNLLLSLGLLLAPSLLTHHNILLADAYRIGDAVGILLRTQTPSAGSSTLEAFRHQLPRFGVSTKTRFDVASLLNADNGIRLNNEGGAGAPMGGRKRRSPQYNKGKGAELPEEHLRLSLSFDEGFHHIPWLDVYHPSKRKVLENLIVTIVYSGSDGSIHAVHRETNYQQTPIPKKGGRAYRDGSGVGGEESNMPKSFTVEYVWVNEADVDVQSGLLALFVAVLIVSLSGMVGACLSSAEEGGTGPSSKGRKYKEKHGSSSLGVGGGVAKRL